MQVWAISAGQADLCARAQDALAAGVHRVLIREIVAPPGLESLVAAWPENVVLHARMHRAQELAGPAGLHLAAQMQAPIGVWGRSCHTPEEVREAQADGAAWTFLSPIFRPISKPLDGRPPLGPSALVGLQTIALGGVTVGNAQGCVQHGAVGVATLSGILFATDVASAAADWLAATAYHS